MLFRPCGFRAGFAAVGTALALALALALPAAAEPDATQKETARTLMWSGDKLSEKGNHREALQAYRAADAIMNVPTTGLAVAKAHEALGELVEARERALRVERSQRPRDESPILTEAREAASQLASSLAGRIPTIVVTVDAPAGTSYEISIDGALAPAATNGAKVNPGAHTVVVRAAGFQDAEQPVTLEERGSRNLRITLEPLSAPASSTADWALIYSGFSVGGAGLIVGGITGGVSISQTDDLLERCGGPRCDASAADDLSSATTLANVSNGAFVVGGVGVVVGVIGVVLAAAKPGGEQRARGPGSALIPKASSTGFSWSFQ